MLQSLDDIGGGWGNSPATITFIVATNNAVYPYVKIIAQNAYETVSDAQDAIDTELSNLVLVGLPSPEFVFVGAIIIDKSGELQLLNDDSLYLDLREKKLSGTGGSSGTVTDHRNLSNRDAVDQHPIASITDLQYALDHIDCGSIA